MQRRYEHEHKQPPCPRCSQPAVNPASPDGHTCDWCYAQWFDSWKHGDAIFMMVAEPQGRLRAMHRWLDGQRIS